jgi:hypothetical protein
VILATVLWVTDLGLPQTVGSASWLAFRVPWIAMLAIIQVPILFLAATFERPPIPSRACRRASSTAPRL